MSHCKGILLATTIAVLAATAASAQSGVERNVRVGSGELRTPPRDARGVLAFKGIPYAAPPVGPLRWRAPQPVPAWRQPRDASRPGNRCFSAWVKDPQPGPPRSEDCLSLNVWTAAPGVTEKQGTAEKRPVMVWIHGGGFQFGSGVEPAIDGARLAQKGAVVVTFNYRLGVLGFLAHPDLDREGPSGNFGLQDQLAALRWVKANISRFGGDPANVTLFGESAGAHAVGILMASPLSRGLFHKAIGQSGAFWDGKNGPLENFTESRARGVAFAGKVGAKSLADLRAMPAEAVNAAAPWDFNLNPMVTVFSPNIDRYVVPDYPSARFARGQQLKIPLLAGWNEAEGHPFKGIGLLHRDAAGFRSAAEGMFGPAGMADFLRLYPAGSEAQTNASSAAFTGDIVISEQTWQWLELQRHTARTPVYGYKFTYTSPYVPIAGHITEVPFVFGTLTPQFIVAGKAPPGEADRALADTIGSYWVNFARSGDPNGPGLPRWPAYGAAGMVQNLGTTVAPQANPDAARFRFIAGYRRRGVFPAAWRAVP